MNNVSFTVEGDKTVTGAACFARFYIPRPLKKVITYHCQPMSKGPDALTEEEIEFWINFCGKILDKKLYEVTRREGFVDVKIKPEMLNGSKNWMAYFTAFRYMDEYSWIIKELYKEKDKPAGQLFNLLQEYQFDSFNKFKKYIGGGHTLYSHKAARTKILTPLKQFKENLAKISDSDLAIDELFNVS